VRLVLLLGVMLIMRPPPFPPFARGGRGGAGLPLFDKAGDFAAFQRVMALAQARCPIRSSA